MSFCRVVVVSPLFFLPLTLSFVRPLVQSTSSPAIATLNGGTTGVTGGITNTGPSRSPHSVSPFAFHRRSNSPSRSIHQPPRSPLSEPPLRGNAKKIVRLSGIIKGDGKTVDVGSNTVSLLFPPRSSNFLADGVVCANPQSIHGVIGGAVDGLTGGGLPSPL